MSNESPKLSVSCQTDITMEYLDKFLNTDSNQIQFKSAFHKLYFNKIKEDLDSLPNMKTIDNNQWYYYKYMEPFYSDIIIHLYSNGTIGAGCNKMCVHCKSEGHVKMRCPVAMKNNLNFIYNF